VKNVSGLALNDVPLLLLLLLLLLLFLLLLGALDQGAIALLLFHHDCHSPLELFVLALLIDVALVPALPWGVD